MVGAMVVIVLVVVAFVLFRDANRDDVQSPVRTVDYTQPAEYARQQAGFELLAPKSLPEGWRATSVRFTPGEEERWHLGLLTDAGDYVGLEQSGSSVDSMLETHVDPEAERGAPVTVAGERWQTWTDAGGDLALARQDGETTTLVVGNEVAEDELAAFIASLR
jgi:hypothetical protein